MANSQPEEELRQYPAREPGQQQLIAWTDLPTNQGNALRVVRVQLPTRYEALLNYLANGRWREADEETAKVMLEVAGQKDRGYLDPEDIRKFPCEDLRIIDRLWVKFSGGRFGFSVQKQIYLETGNKPDGQYREQEFKRFCERIKWRVNNQWLDYEALTFSLEAPEGHLPVIGGLTFEERFVGSLPRFKWDDLTVRRSVRGGEVEIEKVHTSLLSRTDL